VRHTSPVMPGGPFVISVSVAVALSVGLAALPPTASAPAAPPALDWEIISRRPHDATAWTQGLQLDDDGRLYESTGLRGRSTIREVDPQTGAVLRSAPLPDEQFGEGLALVGDRLIQLTWQEGVAHTWDAATFEALGVLDYVGEGWGLCFDGQRLVMSDGSDRLTFRDPTTFEVTGSVQIEPAGLTDMRLNELECVDGMVWANAWLTDTIVRIDPAAGRVTGTLDLAGLLDRVPPTDPPGATTPAPSTQPPLATDPPDVLNGIAWDAASGTFLVTGKLWPALFEIRVSDPG
jgi:glutamine cyclotransferase